MEDGGHDHNAGGEEEFKAGEVDFEKMGATLEKQQ